MQSKATTVDEYIDSLPADRKEAMQKLRKIIKKNIPKGFVEQMSYGMIGWVVPHKIYPAWYHCDPKLPLPFINLASQKNNLALYHMWIYGNPKLWERFQKEYAKVSTKKLDMWKSCIRFVNMNTIPYDFIGELVSKMTVEQRIELYETMRKKTK